MDSLYTRTERRQLAIMRIIYHAKDWVSFDTLADRVNSSKKSIQNDLNILATDFADIMKISLTPRTAKAKFPPDIAFSTIRHMFAQNSLTHSMIREIFFNPGKTLEQIADLTYVSDMTVARRIKAMNSSLQYYYNIRIDNKTMEFVGSEIDIRSFFINFFSEAYNAMTWSFDVDEEAFNDFMRKIIQPFNIPVSFDRFRFFKIATMVSFTRLKQGYRIDDSKVRPDIYQFIKNRRSRPAYANLIPLAEKVFGIELNLDNIIQIFAIFVSQQLTLIEYSPEFYHNNQATVIHSYSYLQEITSRLSQKFNLSMDHSGDFIQRLHNIAHLKHLNIGTKPIFNDHVHKYLKEISLTNPYFYRSLSDEIAGYCQHILKTDDEDLHQYLIYSFYMNWKNLIPQLIFYSHKVRCKALVISYFDYGRAEVTSQLLNTMMGQFIDFHPFYNIELDLEALTNSEFDIIISDFQIPLIPNKLFLTIDDLPQVEDIQEIYNFLYRRRNRIIKEIYGKEDEE